MQKDLQSNVQSVLTAKHSHKRWLRVVSGLMAVAVFVTTYALILPAITLTVNATCGMEEHTHTDDCYEIITVPKKIQVCSTDYGDDLVLHTHDDFCYDDYGNLICELSELTEHTHTEDCYIEVETLICDEEEDLGHTHTDDCYTLEKGELTCTETQSEPSETAEAATETAEDAKTQSHTHTDDCYTWNYTLTCEDTSEEHQHTDDCYATERGDLACTLEETQETETTETTENSAEIAQTATGHTHTDECYQWTKTLTCTEEEREPGHIHDESCYETKTELYCTKPEITAHTHDETCYDSETGELTCTLPQTVAHQHGEDCFLVSEDEFVEQKVLICGMTEHSHSEDCFTTPESLQYTFTDEDVSGTVTIPWSEELPNDLECTVNKVEPGTAQYNAMFSSLDNTVTTTTEYLTEAILYTFEWTSGGEEFILPDSINPTVVLEVINDDLSTSILTGAVLSVSDDQTQDTQEENLEDVPMAADLDDETQPEEAQDETSTNLDNDEITNDTTEETENIPAEMVPVTLTPEVKEGEVLTQTDDTLPQDVQLGGTSRRRLARATTDDDTDVDDTDYDTEITPVVDNTVTLTSSSVMKAAGLVRLKSQRTGSYYKRVSSGSDFKSGEKYVILFADGMALVNSSGSTPYEDIEIRPVAGDENQGYVEIYDTANDKYISPSDSTYSDYNLTLYADSSNYAYFDVDGEYYHLTDHTGTGTGSAAYYDEHCWWLHTANSYYDSTTKSYVYYYMACLKATQRTTMGTTLEWTYMGTGDTGGNRNMVIYRYVGGSLEVVDEMEAETTYESSATVADDITDDYDEYRAITTTPVSESDVDISDISSSSAAVASDLPTSKIESTFGMVGSTLTAQEQYTTQNANDGKLLTDKTVIYKDDDYDAYTDYDNDEFSVTLSALGQEWVVSDNSSVKQPLDVVFIFDTSNSMHSNAYLDGSSTQNRWQASVKAINAAMKDILDANPDNRVGLVAFSSVADVMMPLDHYYEPNDMYLKSIYLDTTWAWDDAWYSVYYTPGSSIYVSDNLKVGSSTGSTASCAGTYFDESGFWAQTYTQLGIQKAYDMFDAVTDTTVTYHVADDQPDVEITRQPVIIMVTDGDPTLATYEYMNPKGGVTYGVGSTHGILGYYTVLSANYFKNMTSIKYQVKAMFYTIGEGIQDPSEENYGSGSYYQDSVDMYSRTVIDPSSDNITEMTQKVSYWFPYGFTSAGEFMALLINKNYAVAVYDDYTYTTYTTYKVYHGSKALYDTSAEYAYLDSGYLGFEAGGYSSYDYNGYTSYRSRYMRGMDNPYGTTNSSGDFVADCSYADGAYFGSLNSDDLEQIFEDIIEEVEVSCSYNFLLEENTNIVFTDNIGEGMEVTAAPVLRYFGTNYSNPTVTTNTQQGYVEYTWPTATATRQSSDTKWYESSTISLASIKARVTTNSDGTQTVTLTIPESVLPTYYPDLNSQFYYEELPIRLIYKVGLTEESITAMNENTSGGTYTYYVGDYDSASTVYQGATVTFRPESSDPYYTALAQTTAKYNNLAKTTGANTSATSTSYFYETVKTSGEVQQILGNNGVLTITVDETQKTVDIEKVWMDNVDHSNDGVYVVIYAKGTKVPAVVADGETVEPEEVTVALDSVYLTAAEDWRATYTLPTPATRTYREVDNQSVTGYTDYVYTFTNFYAMEEPLTDYIATYKKASTTYTQPSEGTTETPTPVTTYTTLTSTQLTVQNPEIFKEQLHMEIEVPTENVVTIETPYDTHNMSTWFSTESYTQSLFELIADSNGNYNVRIENTPTYTLPETGGIGTQWFTISGTALITAGCFMYIFINRKQRHRGKGGIV